MLCAHYACGELRLFIESPHFPGGAVARRTTKMCAVDEGVEVKSVVDSLVSDGDLGKRQECKTVGKEQRLAIAASKLGN